MLHKTQVRIRPGIHLPICRNHAGTSDCVVFLSPAMNNHQRVDGNLKVNHLSIIGQVITVKDWSETRDLARCEKLSQRNMARRSGISQVTVKRALDPADRLEYVAGNQCECDPWLPPVKIPGS